MLDFESEKIRKNKKQKQKKKRWVVFLKVRDFDGEINGTTVMMNEALDKPRTFSESMGSDIEKMSRLLIVRKQQVLYLR